MTRFGGFVHLHKKLVISFISILLALIIANATLWVALVIIDKQNNFFKRYTLWKCNILWLQKPEGIIEEYNDDGGYYFQCTSDNEQSLYDYVEQVFNTLKEKRYTLAFYESSYVDSGCMYVVVSDDIEDFRYISQDYDCLRIYYNKKEFSSLKPKGSKWRDLGTRNIEFAIRKEDNAYCLNIWIQPDDRSFFMGWRCFARLKESN